MINLSKRIKTFPISKKQYNEEGTEGYIEDKTGTSRFWERNS